MATLILGTVGTIIGGPIGGAIGSALGGIIDSQLLFPALFPQPDVEGPRLGELRIQNQEEGAGGNWMVGSDNRVAGTIIWASDVIEVKKEEEVGGKGDIGSTTIITYSYYVSLAIAFAIQRFCTVKRIIAEGKVIYETEGDITITSNQLSVAPVALGFRMRINSPSGGPDLSQFVSGRNVQVSGFSNGANNGTWKCTSAGRNNATGTSYVVLNNIASVTEAAGANANLYQDLATFDPKNLASVTNYDGTQTTADPLIESYEGAGNVPSFKGTSFTVLERLKLDDYGRRIPQLNFVVATPNGTLTLAMDAILLRSGRSAADFDTTGLSGSVPGYNVQGPISTVETLQPLLIAHDILSQEGGAKIRLFHRRNATIIDIRADDLAAHDDGADAPRDAHITDVPDASIPAEVNVKHLDPEIEEQTGSQRQRHPGFKTDGVMSVNLPLVMHGGKARGIAKRLLWIAWADRQTITLQLPPTYYYIQENDVLRFYADGALWHALVQKVDVGAQWLVIVECVLEIRSVLTQTEEYDAKDNETGQITSAPFVDDEFFETPPLTPTGTVTNTPVIGTATAIEESTPWPGIRIFVAPDDEEEDFLPFDDVIHESTMGVTASVLGSATPHYWDRASTVDVYLVNGTLSTREELDVLNGANRALIGGEIIGFANATLIDTNTYRLSILLRGLRDTVDQMGTHATGERFVLLNAGITQTTVNAGWVGTTRYFRAVPGGGDLSDYPSTPLTIQGTSLKPFSPAALRGDRDGSGNLTISWVRRTRAVYEIFAVATAPLAEDDERYEIEIWYGAAKKRTLSVAEATSVAYTTAMMGDDGVPTFAAVEARVYQLSRVVGRGKGLIGSI